jgi:hypothetical protein
MENETNLDYIKRTNRLIDDRYFTLQDNWCRVSALEFEKIKEDWKLTLIYFDTTQQIE